MFQDSVSSVQKNLQPLPSKKVSINHVNQHFNEVIQIYFAYFRAKLLIVLTMTGTDTGYTEVGIIFNRSMTTVAHYIETTWIFQHGNPKAVTGGDEFNNDRFDGFTTGIYITARPRLMRQSNQISYIERKQGLLKLIVERIEGYGNTAPVMVIFARAVYFSNIFSNESIFNSVELAKGYAPAILGNA